MESLVPRNPSFIVILAMMLTMLVPAPLIAASGEPVPFVYPGNVSEPQDAKVQPQEEKDKKEKKEKPEKAKGKPIKQTEDYGIEIACEYEESLDQTTCVFTGVVPDGGKKINHFDIPADSICAEVLDGNFAIADPDPHSGVNGYSTRANEAAITLILQGEVTVSGTTTYWFKVANNVFPATGSGLSCAASDDEQADQSSPTATSESSAGSLVVTNYTCVDVPEQRDEFDWFAGCHLLDGSPSYDLVSIESGAAFSDTVSATSTGELTFAPLDAGTYQLTLSDDTWCHAESDNVDSEGNVIVVPGQQTHVWIFMCP